MVKFFNYINTNLEIILSEKRKKLHIHQSYLYRRGRENIQNNYISWRCLTKICQAQCEQTEMEI
ncbi:hypothetical protein HZS_2281 [Henneguya salminicola]|nr:hypothetical protein HZS_2281 [Henneguya salminicola]